MVLGRRTGSSGRGSESAAARCRFERSPTRAQQLLTLWSEGRRRPFHQGRPKRAGMRASLLLGMVGVLLSGATAMAVGLPNRNQFSPYTLQLSDIGAGFYKLRAARPHSNARAIKEGTPAIIIRRFGRLGGYERDFEAKHFLKEDLVAIGSTVVGTRTAAGA